MHQCLFYLLPPALMHPTGLSEKREYQASMDGCLVESQLAFTPAIFMAPINRPENIMRISGSNIRKMPKVLFTTLFSLFWLSSLCSQDINQVKEYADVQFAKGNHSIALKEYQRVLLFDQDKQYNQLYEQIASIYYNQESYSDAEVYYDFAWKASQNDSIKLELSFKKALCNLKDSRYLLAITELLDIPDGLSPYFENKLNQVKEE